MFETWRSVPSPLLKGYSGTIQHLTVEKVIEDIKKFLEENNKKWEDIYISVELDCLGFCGSTCNPYSLSEAEYRLNDYVNKHRVACVCKSYCGDVIIGVYYRESKTKRRKNK